MIISLTLICRSFFSFSVTSRSLRFDLSARNDKNVTMQFRSVVIVVEGYLFYCYFCVRKVEELQVIGKQFYITEILTNNELINF